jgi:hypothetical protein
MQGPCSYVGCVLSGREELLYVCEREGCASIGTKKKVHKPCCEEYLNTQKEVSGEDLSEWQDDMYGQLDRNVCFTCHSKILSIEPSEEEGKSDGESSEDEVTPLP